MKKQLVFILMSLLFVATAYAQRTVTVQGVVTDANFKEPVIGGKRSSRRNVGLQFYWYENRRSKSRW